jgi:zinc/manganese transport system permease protein
MDLSLFLPPLAACLVIVAIHSYLGLHVIAREVIFVDLSLAQMAALGSTVAILAGSQSDSAAALIYALGFTTLGAAVFALTRSDEGGRVPQEAIIGIVYVVASAAAILVADRTPRGGEAIKDILVGSLLWVTWPTIIRLAGIYLVLGLFHWVLRKRFLTISFQPATALANGWSIRWWDFLFYLSFGIVITFSVPIAGVLLVFSFLVVPAAIAFQFTDRQGVLAVIAWLTGALASASGLLISFRYDLPTGPIVVCMFGVLLLIAFGVRKALGLHAVAEREAVEMA